MNYQVDFGNLSVGVATIAIAVVSFVVSMKNIKSSNANSRAMIDVEGRRRVAEFRREWIEVLRMHLAEFARCYTMIMVKYKKDETTSSFDFALQKIREGGDDKEVSNLLYHGHYIKLLINPNEENGKKLHEIISELTRGSGKYKLGDFTEQSRIIMKYEWDRLKVEVTFNDKE
ncbi:MULTISPECIES: hypothetical protein [unclassified Chelatococcus]|uniref:hypothetical protein n=1 Tax=unclassified Chelatococcus TaxID=2638111 RepID=UPI0012E28111|nr:MULTISPECIES: hypothetical protein [unclassified Chelatococcus]